MKRRALLAFAIPAMLHAQEMALHDDQWQDFAQVWNPFATKMNGGVFDVKLWRKVVKAVEKIEGKACKG